MGRDKEPHKHEHIDEDATQSFGSGDSDEQVEARAAEGENLEPAEGSREDYDLEIDRIVEAHRKEEARKAPPPNGERGWRSRR